MNLYNAKTHELNDKKIIQLLKQAIADYEDGAISEAQDALIDIVDAIQEFDEANNARHTI